MNAGKASLTWLLGFSDCDAGDALIAELASEPARLKAADRQTLHAIGVEGAGEPLNSFPAPIKLCGVKPAKYRAESRRTRQKLTASREL